MKYLLMMLIISPVVLIVLELINLLKQNWE